MLRTPERQGITTSPWRCLRAATSFPILPSTEHWNTTPICSVSCSGILLFNLEWLIAPKRIERDLNEIVARELVLPSKRIVFVFNNICITWNSLALQYRGQWEHSHPNVPSAPFVYWSPILTAYSVLMQISSFVLCEPTPIILMNLSRIVQEHFHLNARVGTHITRLSQQLLVKRLWFMHRHLFHLLMLTELKWAQGGYLEIKSLSLYTKR